MGKVGIFTIHFANQSKIYYPGQFVQGEVQCEVKEEVKIREIRLEFAGIARVRWTESHGSGKNRRTVTYYSSEDYFVNVVPCQTPPSGQEKMMLQPGSYRYPFQFQIPVGVPSSFEGHFGRVRYYVKATMDRPWAFDEEVTSFFTVLNLLDLNTLPDAQKPGDAEGSKTICCLCCESGPISGKHKIHRLGYVPGEAIPISAECINHSSRNVKTRMQLVQVIYYKTPRKTRPVSTVVQEVENKMVPKGDSDVWGGTSLVIPPLPSSGLVGCNIIDLQYYWQFVCEPSGPALTLRIPINIIIGGIPLVSAAQQYGATNPMSSGFSGAMPPPPEIAFPRNVPTPGFASFSTQYPPAGEEQGQGNNVAPTDQENDTFLPQYPYYNWNQYDTNFKPTSY